MLEVRQYATAAGVSPFRDWLDGLGDPLTEARIFRRIDRLERGLFGDCKPCGAGVWELRIDLGPGYRVYYARVGKAIVLLLCAGDKRKQQTDIERAKEYLDDYLERQKSSA
jgi:putative addiction module killer protein